MASLNEPALEKATERVCQWADERVLGIGHGCAAQLAQEILTAYLEAVGDGWQPISTAPKDGTPYEVLNHDLEVWIAKLIDGRVAYRTHGLHCPESYQVVLCTDEAEVRKVDLAFAEKNEAWRDDWTFWTRGYEFRPTHWRPLPAPPQEGE